MLPFPNYSKKVEYNYNHSFLFKTEQLIKFLIEFFESLLINGILVKAVKQIPRKLNKNDGLLYEKFELKGCIEIDNDQATLEKMKLYTKSIRQNHKNYLNSLEEILSGNQTALNINKKQCPKIYQLFQNGLNSKFYKYLEKLTPNYQVDQVTYMYNTERDYNIWAYNHPQNHVHENSSWHVDTTVNSVKILVYLNDVLKYENGPFCYIDGSHMLNNNWYDRTVMRAVGRRMIWFLDEDSKRKFSSLPNFFQKKNQFGNDITEYNKYWNEIKKNEYVFLGKAGSILLFNSYGIHRGGIVSKGTREAFQIRFRSGFFV